VIADAAGHAIAFRIAPGQAHELPYAIPLLGRLPGVPQWVIADRGYTGHRFREHIWDMGHDPRSRRNAKRNPWPAQTGSTTTATASSASGRLKEWRAVATRYEKTAASFAGVLCLAATLDRLSDDRPRRRKIETRAAACAPHRCADLLCSS
jgi:transposase